jgi:hypothetical protein
MAGIEQPLRDVAARVAEGSGDGGVHNAISVRPSSLLQFSLGGCAPGGEGLC